MMKTKRSRRRKGKNIIKACLSKKRHDTEEEAKETAIWQAEQEDCGVEGCCPVFNVYKCIFCEGFHTYRVKSEL